MGLDGERTVGGLGCIAVIVVVLIVVLGGLVLMDSIEGSRADRAQAKASAEQAIAGARIAEAEADVQKQLDRQRHEIDVLQQRQSEFEKNFALAALAISNMNDKDVGTLERWLGLDKTSPLAIVVAAALAVLAFLLTVLSWPFIKRAIDRQLEEMWTTQNSPS